MARLIRAIRSPFEYLGLVDSSSDPNNYGIGPAFVQGEDGHPVAANPAPGSPRYLREHPDEVELYRRDGEPLAPPTGKLAELLTKLTAKLN